VGKPYVSAGSAPWCINRAALVGQLDGHWLAVLLCGGRQCFYGNVGCGAQQLVVPALAALVLFPAGRRARRRTLPGASLAAVALDRANCCATKQLPLVLLACNPHDSWTLAHLGRMAVVSACLGRLPAYFCFRGSAWQHLLYSPHSPQLATCKVSVGGQSGRGLMMWHLGAGHRVALAFPTECIAEIKTR